jgi:formylglycine-generating enzyme required for sulfatase activity
VIKEVPRLAEDTAARQEAVQQRERAESLEKKAEEEEHKRLAAEAAAAKAKEETAKATMPPPVVLKAVPVGTPATTTKSLPFENSLGMKFVPVPIGAGESKGQRVLFSIWETRSKDYAAFVKATSHDAGDDWKTYIFKDFPVGRGMGENTEESNHPVANVSYNDAVVFCEWLTKKDRASGHIGPKDEYRLPTDTEWSLVVGIGDMEDASASPQDKDGKLTGIYPWGTSYPPPTGSGNYADTAAKTKFGGDWSIIEGYTDGYATTAPVGTFNANSLGLYDLGGNLWEWTSSAWETGSTSYVLRGGSWDSGAESSVLSSIRRDDSRDYRYYYGGFRCVLVVGGGSTSGKVKTSSDPTATSEFGGKSTSVTATIQGRPSKFVVARDPARATISLPYANSLDMLFVPVPETNVLFSVFETRGRDFARYPGSGTDEEIVTAMAGNWKECEYEGIAVGRGEGETAVTSHHPVVNVTWGDAKGFCDWLSAQDRKAGVSSQPSFNYRLPTDAEWSAAVGVADEPKELQSRNSSSALG